MYYGSMKLLTRLTLSQVVPLGLIGAALFVTVGSVLRLTENIGELRDDLDTMNQEHQLHRAAWAVDVTLRQVHERCEQGASIGAVQEQLAAQTSVLEGALGGASAAKPSLRLAAERYRDLARKIQDNGMCKRAAGLQAMREELQLDEQLTDAWLLETQALHGAMVSKEEEARRLSQLATRAGLLAGLLAAVSLVLAVRSIARSVTGPLETLAGAARQIGQGDFSREISAAGPNEVTALAAELDGMRQQLAKLDHLKQGFLASISHELRTPLTKIREALSLLGDGAAGPLTDRQRRVVKIAQDACEREIRMVSTLLELSRLRAGTPLRMQAGTTIDRVIQSAIEYERDGAQGRGVPVELIQRGDLPALCLDGALLERAIANLIRNAVSVSPPGSSVKVVREQLPTDPEGREGSWVRIGVEDQGPGVSPELRAQLFVPFVSHEVTTAGRPAGVGLGLALSREIARAHGGDLFLENSPPPGAVFSIWLPLQLPLSASPLPSSP